MNGGSAHRRAAPRAARAAERCGPLTLDDLAVARGVREGRALVRGARAAAGDRRAVAVRAALGVGEGRGDGRGDHARRRGERGVLRGAVRARDEREQCDGPR